MTENQVFAILQRYGGIRAARIITENTKKMSKIKLLYTAYQLRHGVPVAKIIHKKWFYGLAFYTNKNTLDPRPDTETLVSAVISDCIANQPKRILDLGTGTGCIICSLVKNIPHASGMAIDISRPALRVAKRNIKNFGLTNLIKLKKLSFDTLHKITEKFDIIVSNPPYIAKKDPRVNPGALHDPKIALYANNNGLAAYETIAKNAKSLIKENGKIYLEIGIDQGTDIKKIFTKNGWSFVESKQDLSGIERVLIFKSKKNEKIN